jgi:tRNA nucleotidyltransferase (CCA-adding enzyme)
MNSRDKAIKICKILHENKYEAYLVGGAIRDELLGKEPKDYDITTIAKPEEIQKILKNYKTLEMGKAFGIITCLVEDEPFEIATFRTERGTIDGRHPTSVEFVSSIEEDLSRRDFTMNAIAYDPIHDKYINPFDGIKDIKERKIRFVGDPEKRIKEDYLRILRAFRFMSTLQFTIEDKSLSELDWTITDNNCLNHLSQERIYAEFIKLISGDGAVLTINYLIKNKLLFKIIPELEDQLQPHNSPRWHKEIWEGLENSILAHTMHVFAHSVNLTKNDSIDNKIILRTAAILHDIGKPTCRENKGDHDRFLGHDFVGAKIAEERLTKMKFPTDYMNPIVSCVKNHMNCHNLLKTHDIAKIRRFLGKKYFPYIYQTAIFDTMGTLNETAPEPDCSNLTNLVFKYKKEYPNMLPNKIINGYTLIEEGFQPSEAFRDTLEKTYDQQLRGINDKQKLLNFAKGIYKQWKPKSKES